ncbi:MAG: hypothetical protein LAT63_02985 [Marinobacter sp.]|nr:hypothetical protein [Marinobacter sp.]
MPHARAARIRSAQWAVILTSTVMLSGCGGGSSSADKPTPPADTTPFTGELRGILTAPNGTSAIPGATVYIPDDGISPLAFSASNISSQSSADCAEPPVTSLAWGCTDASGRFSFTIDLPAGSTVQLNAVRGAWSMSTQLVLDFAFAGTLRFPANPADGAAKIAVVTGSFDNIENVLAKMGLAEWEEWDGDLPFPLPLTAQNQVTGHQASIGVNFQGYRRLGDTTTALASDTTASSASWKLGSFRPGTETFSIYEGIYDYDYEDEYEQNQQGSVEALGGWPDYPFVSTLFEPAAPGQPARIFDYDIVYINCGAIEPEDLENEFGIDNWRATLRNFVHAGGVLYVTDLSSPFITGAFDDYLYFFSEADEIEELTGTAADTDLKNYLRNSQCIGGSACATANGNLQIYDFGDGWHLLAPVSEMQGTQVEKLVTGNVSSYLLDPSHNAPNGLTLAFNHGQGKVIFSSYHVSGSLVPRHFNAQERILERLFWVTTGG